MDDPTRSLDDRRELASRIRSSRRSEESHMEQLDPCRSQAIVLHAHRCSSSPSHGRSSRHHHSRGSASRLHQGMLDQLVDPTSEHCDVLRSGSRSIIERLTSILGARAHGSRISPRRAEPLALSRSLALGRQTTWLRRWRSKEQNEEGRQTCSVSE